MPLTGEFEGGSPVPVPVMAFLFDSGLDAGLACEGLIGVPTSAALSLGWTWEALESGLVDPYDVAMEAAGRAAIGSGAVSTWEEAWQGLEASLDVPLSFVWVEDV